MSFSDAAGLTSMSTLAHELGHSMHTLLSAKTQPYTYAGYSLFVAEVASNFNQALTRAHLLNATTDRNFQIGLIEEAMQNFHRYLFLMPILSQWERFVHGEIERGNALGADVMSNHLAELFKRGYGPAMHVDVARVGITWAQFSHFYADFYVFQYASGISAANALADVILHGDDAAVKRYLKFLGTGGSKYPLVALKQAGIDMSKPEPMDRAFKVLEGFVDRLEKLV
jgi:oligoendopeptidase F